MDPKSAGIFIYAFVLIMVFVFSTTRLNIFDIIPFEVLVMIAVMPFVFFFIVGRTFGSPRLVRNVSRHFVPISPQTPDGPILLQPKQVVGKLSDEMEPNESVYMKRKLSKLRTKLPWEGSDSEITTEESETEESESESESETEYSESEEEEEDHGDTNHQTNGEPKQPLNIECENDVESDVSLDELLSLDGWNPKMHWSDLDYKDDEVIVYEESKKNV